MGGVLMTHLSRARLYATLDKLHHEAEQHKLLLDNGGIMCPDASKSKTDDVEVPACLPSTLHHAACAVLPIQPGKS